MSMPSAAVETFNYKVVRQFAIMTLVWGIVGMAVGVLIAAQLLWPELTPPVTWLSYGRLRPLHTNAVIFAFGGSALFATSYYVVQRTCQVRLFSDGLAAFREGAGPDMGILLDTNFNFKTEGYIKVARACEPFDLFWLEIDSYDPEGLRLIRDRAAMPIALSSAS